MFEKHIIEAPTAADALVIGGIKLRFPWSDPNNNQYHQHWRELRDIEWVKDAPRKVNDMFHIDGERLIKTSNGQPIPHDEPIFILRGRDAIAEPTITHYIVLGDQAGMPDDRRQQLLAVRDEFYRYAIMNKTKVPGITHGK